ncbi:unnamed protein product [Phaedon cochleariae]|uniref:SWIM-type domain-containing protein n=1 Tax=Phaedon cochleariae TaxID=80249 RepID=A0A9N9SEJ7_PHACE|nr:unnamed protein product [Phaedon cochleariae]
MSKTTSKLGENKLNPHSIPLVPLTCVLCTDKSDNFKFLDINCQHSVENANNAYILLYSDGKSRPVVEGEAVLRANHVISGEAEDFNKRHIFALCQQTPAMKSSTHEVKLKLGSRGTLVEKWICICSCKAGQSGYCKHVVAVLLYVN